MSDEIVNTSKAPAPVGAYPHARRVGDLLFLSGVGPRQPGTNEIPGGPIEDEDGNALDYDVSRHVRATIENVKVILEAAGSPLYMSPEHLTGEAMSPEHLTGEAIAPGSDVWAL